MKYVMKGISILTVVLLLFLNPVMAVAENEPADNIIAPPIEADTVQETGNADEDKDVPVVEDKDVPVVDEYAQSLSTEEQESEGADGETEKSNVFIYSPQPVTMAEVQEAVDSYEATGEKAKWELEVPAKLMPEGWYCDAVEDNEAGVMYWTFFRSAMVMAAKPVQYVITEKYADENGNAVPNMADTRTIISAKNSYSKEIPVLSGYVIIGYRIGSPSADLQSGIVKIEKVTSNITVYFVYHKLDNTTISVSYPARGMDFYVNETTYPAVKSNGQNNSGYYTFTNHSDYPVKITFVKMTVKDDAGLAFVSDAASSVKGGNYISLSLKLPTSVSANGFTSGVGSIVQGSRPVVLGTLSGKHIKGASAASSSGYVTIGGYYAGYLNGTTRTPQLTFNFTFTLVAG